MPLKQTNPQTTATGAASARVAKPGKPRVTASKHSKTSAAEAATVMVKETPHEEEVKEIIASLTEPIVKNSTAGDPLEVISRLAYGYWAERGGIGGDALADWVRAEEEYRRQLAQA